MAILRVFWNFVKADADYNLAVFANSQLLQRSTIKAKIARGCKGALFRAVLTEEQDFSQYLSEMKLEDVRRARNEPDNSLLFRPKREEEKSIATLPVVRPKRLTRVGAVLN